MGIGSNGDSRRVKTVLNPSLAQALSTARYAGLRAISFSLFSLKKYLYRQVKNSNGCEFSGVTSCRMFEGNFEGP